jgi:hypothetical protein
MRGVAEQHHAAVDPALDRIAVAGHPRLPVLAVMNDRLRARMDVAKTFQHLVVGDGLGRRRCG